ncbi:uncharacterized protein LOC129301493 [Prosopis cineraria]|uniref:uncharacterized protein LOC129301493 n=1 Tax=Prosopis cineraria TaxID=364024 RepID=UPI00240F96E6|nr:uncharacterized protein LOC129301493 [Prosopis cineraria]
MAPESHIFYLSGHVYLKSVDWNNANHRRCVLAKLGTRSICSRNEQGRTQFPGLTLLRLLPLSAHRDPPRQLQPLRQRGRPQLINSKFGNPKYVIAFRGMILTRPTLPTDVFLSVRSYFGILHNSPRLHLAVDRVQHWVAPPAVLLTSGSPGILFVSGYVGYFEQRIKMIELGAAYLRIWLQSLLLRA